MKVVLIRHAEAGERDPSRWADDGQRPVTAEGRQKQTACSRAMKKLGIDFDFLVSSPLVRARETAEIVADAFGYEDEILMSVALGPDATGEGVVKLLAKYPPDKTVALVGHEPSLSEITAALIGRSADAKIRLKKSGVIGISFDGAAAIGAGWLDFHLKPGQLRKVGR